MLPTRLLLKHGAGRMLVLPQLPQLLDPQIGANVRLAAGQIGSTVTLCYSALNGSLPGPVNALTCGLVVFGVIRRRYPHHSRYPRPSQDLNPAARGVGTGLIANPCFVPPLARDDCTGWNIPARNDEVAGRVARTTACTTACMKPNVSLRWNLHDSVSYAAQ